MINNFQDLILKYKAKINSKSETENKIINFISENLNLKLDNKNIKIDFKNKKVNFVNLNSSLRFVLKNKINQEIKDLFLKEINLNLEF